MSDITRPALHRKANFTTFMLDPTPCTMNGGGSHHEILEGGEAGDALLAAEILRRSELEPFLGHLTEYGDLNDGLALLS